MVKYVIHFLEEHLAFSKEEFIYTTKIIDPTPTLFHRHHMAAWFF